MRTSLTVLLIVLAIPALAEPFTLEGD